MRRAVAVAIATALVVLATSGTAAADPPFAETEVPRSTSATTVTFVGYVEMGGLNTTYRFDYALSGSEFCTSGGTSGTATSTETQQIPPSSYGERVEVGAAGLTGGASYCVVFFASNGQGTDHGGSVGFTAGAPLAYALSAQVTGTSTAAIDGVASAAGQSGATGEVWYALVSSQWCQSDARSGSPTGMTAPTPLGFSDAEEHEVSLPVSGLTAGERYCATIVARNASGASVPRSPDLVFFDAGRPKAETSGASATSASTAEVTGWVNPGGQETTVRVGYGPATSPWCASDGESGSPPSTTGTQDVPSATDDVDVTVGVTNLTPGIRYCALLIAENAGGTSRPTGTKVFVGGAAGVRTDEAVPTGPSTATISGAVDPAGQTTTYAVGYDVSGSDFCNSGDAPPAQTTTPQPLGFTDTAFHAVTVDLTGLTPGAGYCAAIIATNASATAHDEPVAFTAGAPTARTGSVGITGLTTATVAGEVNPGGLTTTYRVRFDFADTAFCDTPAGSGTPSRTTASQTLGFTDGTFHPVSVPLTGLVHDARYCAQVAATNSRGTSLGPKRMFVAALPPIVGAVSARSRGADGVRLTGTVDPNGSATSVVFRYALAGSAWCTSGGTSGTSQATTSTGVGSGSGLQTVPVDVFGLTPGATYCWSFEATSLGGTVRDGPSGSGFTVGVPTTVTGAATALGDTTATLNATVNPQGNPTTFLFAYGPASSQFCTSNGAAGAPLATLSPAEVGFTDTSAHLVSASIGGLTAGTAYCFRAASANAAGSTTGDFSTFTTTGGGLPPADAGITPPPIGGTPPGGGGVPPAVARLGSIGRVAKVARSRAKVKIRCSAGAPCAGRLVLRAKVGRKTKTIGTASFLIPAGSTKTVNVKLSAPARRAMRTGRLKVKASATAGSSRVSRTVTLVRAKR